MNNPSFPTRIRRPVESALRRRALILDALRRPRTQQELQDRVQLSASGTLNLLRRMEADGLIFAAERIENLMIWEIIGPDREA